MNIFDIQIAFGNEVPNKISLNIYFSGCFDNKKCERHLCQNNHIHDFSNGYSYKNFLQEIKEIISKNDLIECVCYLGGEPLDQDINKMLDFTNKIRSTNSDIPIYSFTGYDYADNKGKIDNFASVLRITNIYAGHYSPKYNCQAWIKNSF